MTEPVPTRSGARSPEPTAPGTARGTASATAPGAPPATAPAGRDTVAAGMRTWGLGTAAQVLVRARLAQLRRHATVGAHVRLEPSTQIKVNVAGLVLGTRVRLARGVVLRLDTPNGRLHLGDGTAVHEYSILHTQQGWIEVGRNVSIHPFGVINGEGGIRIGDDVRIAARVTILSSTHVFTDPDTPVRSQPIEPLPVSIGDDVWVGTGVTVLGGVTVGRGSVIGAGAVVNRDVRPFTVVAGVPARPVGTRGPDRGPGPAVSG